MLAQSAPNDKVKPISNWLNCAKISEGKSTPRVMRRPSEKYWLNKKYWISRAWLFIDLLRCKYTLVWAKVLYHFKIYSRFRQMQRFLFPAKANSARFFQRFKCSIGKMVFSEINQHIAPDFHIRIFNDTPTAKAGCTK